MYIVPLHLGPQFSCGVVFSGSSPQLIGALPVCLCISVVIFRMMPAFS